MNFCNFTTTLIASAVTTYARGAADGMIGTIDPSEWKKLNKEAGAKMIAIAPSTGKLSADDEMFIAEITMGGMMQPAPNKAALAKVTTADVEASAQAEVDEQNLLASEPQEIAETNGLTLPTELDDKARKTVTHLGAKSGADFDREYLQRGGVTGHLLLEKTMTKSESTTSNMTLKEIAATTLPLIKTHLRDSQSEMSDKG